jgi:ubiquinone/menaquinone biosynthesis C-methylase UbiE
LICFNSSHHFEHHVLLQTVSNFFAHASAAERYAKARPYFHPLVIERIRAHLNLERPVPRALDVACGTGQSARALQAIAEHVTGTDLSSDMLKYAKENPGIEFLESPAERLSFKAETFDLLTVCMAFHWFDQPKFLLEARRVLKPDGWLVVYNNAARAQMIDNPAFGNWADQFYVNYPAPARAKAPTDPAFFSTHGFQLDPLEEFENHVSFTPDELAAYMTTQSNFIAKVEQGSESLEEVHAKIVDGATPFFAGPRVDFLFVIRIFYLRKQ